MDLKDNWMILWKYEGQQDRNPLVTLLNKKEPFPLPNVETVFQPYDLNFVKNLSRSVSDQGENTFKNLRNIEYYYEKHPLIAKPLKGGGIQRFFRFMGENRLKKMTTYYKFPSLIAAECVDKDDKQNTLTSVLDTSTKKILKICSSGCQRTVKNLDDSGHGFKEDILWYFQLYALGWLQFQRKYWIRPYEKEGDQVVHYSISLQIFACRLFFSNPDQFLIGLKNFTEKEQDTLEFLERKANSSFFSSDISLKTLIDSIYGDEKCVIEHKDENGIEEFDQFTYRQSKTCKMSDFMIKHMIHVQDSPGSSKLFILGFFEEDIEGTTKKGQSFMSFQFTIYHPTRNSPSLLSQEKSPEIRFDKKIKARTILFSSNMALNEYNYYRRVDRVADNLYNLFFIQDLHEQFSIVKFSLNMESYEFEVKLFSNYMECCVETLKYGEKWVLYFLDDCKTRVLTKQI